MAYLLWFIGVSLATGLIYYRQLYKKCEQSRDQAHKNRYLWDDWGE